MKLVKPLVEMNEKEQQKVIDADQSKSSKMRELFDSGMGIKAIATALDVRYNFVYNVVSRHILSQQIPEDLIEKNQSKGSNLKDQIKELLSEDPEITTADIARELGKNYNYVWKLRKEVETSEQ